MSWNYRVVQREFAGTTSFGVHEVYYDDQDQITAWSEAMIAPSSDDSVEDLRADLAHMMQALAQPVLLYDDLPGAVA